mgnify:CR=1 FL=1|tara:strand:+ start:2039 stop:2329 length:291 start_codon:yes stop_codon:yes gene_type:complete
MTETQEILEGLGLTPEEVRAAFGLGPPSEKPKKRGYLFRHDQVRMNKRMRDWERMIYARYISGMHPKVIAGCLGVSEETVRVRLRKSGFFDKDFRT